MRRMRLLLMVMLVSLALRLLTAAQDEPAVITAQNVRALRSVAQVDFADQQHGTGDILNGWFTMDASGEIYVVKNRSDDLIIWDENGNRLSQYAVTGEDRLNAVVMDVGFIESEGAVVSVHVDGKALYVSQHYVQSGLFTIFKLISEDAPLRVWMGDSGNPMLEMSSNDGLAGRYVMEITIPQPLTSELFYQTVEIQLSDIRRFPSGPENDPDSFLRIGRIDPPLAVTVTQDFLTKRWNLEAGEVTATAQLTALPGGGQITPDGQYFAWRDGESEALHLLDFESGEDRVVTSLDGTYIPFLLLTPAADVIIGVNTGLEPVVTVWDAGTGERFDLGEYRPCNRQPDMVRLSRDGTTLVIGCDTGLDIWRVQD